MRISDWSSDVCSSDLAWFAGRNFADPVLQPPPSSGPYRIARVDAGRSLVFERVKDWWGRDLPAHRGQHNFDIVREDYYRDREIAAQASVAGEYDYREEITERLWATGYKGRPAFHAGRVRRGVLQAGNTEGQRVVREGGSPSGIRRRA